MDLPYARNDAEHDKCSQVREKEGQEYEVVDASLALRLDHKSGHVGTHAHPGKEYAEAHERQDDPDNVHVQCHSGE